MGRGRIERSDMGESYVKCLGRVRVSSEPHLEVVCMGWNFIDDER